MASPPPPTNSGCAPAHHVACADEEDNLAHTPHIQPLPPIDLERSVQYVHDVGGHGRDRWLGKHLAELLDHSLALSLSVLLIPAHDSRELQFCCLCLPNKHEDEAAVEAEKRRLSARGYRWIIDHMGDGQVCFAFAHPVDHGAHRRQASVLCIGTPRLSRSCTTGNPRHPQAEAVSSLPIVWDVEGNLWAAVARGPPPLLEQLDRRTLCGKSEVDDLQLCFVFGSVLRNLNENVCRLATAVNGVKCCVN